MQVFLPLVARTVRGVEQLGQVIRESGVPLAELEAPFKMCAVWASWQPLTVCDGNAQHQQGLHSRMLPVLLVGHQESAGTVLPEQALTVG